MARSLSGQVFNPDLSELHACCLDAVANDYESVETILSEIQEEMTMPISKEQLAITLRSLWELGLVAFYEYDDKKKEYICSQEISSASEKTWFLITDKGLSML